MIARPSRPEPASWSTLTPMERQVLETLARTGPCPAWRLPVRWPLIRMHLPLVIERLSAVGLIQVAPSAAAPATVALTLEGAAILDANEVSAATPSMRAYA
jgi:hypothetical protein